MKKFTILCAFLFSCSLVAQNQTWLPVGDVPVGLHHPVTFAIGDFGYMITGTNSFGAETKKMYRYNPKIDSWATMTDFPGASRSFSIGLEYKGYGYLGFGAGSGQYYKDLWRFDTATNQWTQLADCGCIGRRHPAFMAANDKIYLGLGNNANGDLRDFWVYDIPSDSWSQLPNIPGLARHHPFMFSVNGEVFAGMGHGGQIIYDDWYRFDTVNNSWQTLTDFPGEARVAGTQFDHNGYGYVLSGDGDNHSFMSKGEMWRYDSGNDTWTQSDSHPGVSRWAPGSFVVGDTLYFFGGFNRFNQTFPTTMFKYSFNSAGIGLEEEALTKGLFYPNPSEGMVRISNEKTWERIVIQDLQGRTVQSWDTPKESLDLSSLNDAIYLIRFEAEDGSVFHERIMIRP
ncbi:MAG: T9SS type A sorting domain-containing protein [Bacteroidetes bacterium]|nr:T9SS type A sorting domain-containing protein [Bacteroidota bacterium]